MAKYLTGKELLDEIQRCKSTYCTFLEDRYSHYDMTVSEGEEIDIEIIRETARELCKEPHELVIRKMTHDHIPHDEGRRRVSKITGEKHAKTSFPPFKHYIYEDGLREVGRSHWEGDFETGHFTNTKGRMSNRLARMFMMMAERYSRKPNFHGYSYRSDMVAAAMTHLADVGLQFNESKSNNPFAFYTTTIHRVFLRILKNEKKHQAIRDDLLIDAGYTPSSGRQVTDAVKNKTNYSS